MSETQRLKRPEPERTAPIRGGWLNLFAAPRPSGASDGSNEPAGADGAARATPASSDPVARAVELGYRVVDEYVRQGQEVAKRFGGRRGAPAGFGGDVQDLMTRWFQYTSELTEVWFQLVGLAAAGQMPRASAPQEGSGPPATAAPSASPLPLVAAADGEPTRVGVQVVCSRPVEVMLDLRPVAAGTRLRVHDLRAADPEKPRIAGVSVERGIEGGPLQLRIRIPEGQPSGTYSGLVLDEATSLPAGTVAVRVP